MRTRLLLGAIACLVLATPFATPLAAQMSPSISGETGLFQVTNAEMLPQGRFSLGLSWGLWNRTAASVPFAATLSDDPLRYDVQRFGGSVAYGLLSRWEASLSTGSNRYSASSFNWQGIVNGHYRSGGFTHSEMDKVRIGTKILLNTQDPVLVALFGGIAFPTQSKNDVNALGTYRADYDLGLSFNVGWVTFQSAYQLNGKLGTPTSFPNVGETGYDISNTWTSTVAVAVPVIPNIFKAIGELNRVHYDGGDTQPPDFSEITLGGRFAFGNSGFTASGAVRVNIDRWTKYGSNPSSIGGLVQVAYLPPPVVRERPRAALPREAEPPPATEPVPPPPAPVMAPMAEPAVVTAPAPRPSTSTTDEILYDAAKSRLTNIAKAILDGVALRLKNNLAATCTVSASTDAKEKGGDHAALAKARAEAARDYLMKRHGIDGSRIATEVKGDADSADATRNRRAVVTVTFP
ncbi:MAG TPA: OmpA family protein [Thermoanaerobaculia bacterium]|jgi:outer membrane protein OmpA-like peptidoglycan-associated protein